MKKEDLEFAFKLANPCLVSSNFIPVLNHFCFAEELVYAYDDVSAIIVGLESGLSCAMHGGTLSKLVSLAAAEVKLTKSKEGVSFSSGSTKAELPCLGPDEFLFSLPEEDFGNEFVFTDELLEALEICTAGVSQDPLLNKAWTAVAVTLGTSPTLFAYDNVGLVQCTPSTPLGKKARKVLIAESTCAQIVSIAKALDIEAESICFQSSENYIRVDFEGEREVYLIGKLLPEKAPDYSALISKLGITGKPFKLPADFGKAVEQVSVVLSEETEPACVVNVSGQEMRVSGSGKLGAAESKLKLDKPVKDAGASVDPGHLLRYRGKFDRAVIDDGGIVLYGEGISYYIGPVWEEGK
jgi:hypothetical protein